ncbi:MAG TPA: Crp/Fnr family transcriptional regulator [Candidatus Babeliales bacterium]|nr:Crp/Fnr family transcriptional regulator [Candidatus Babeliales bacterium]
MLSRLPPKTQKRVYAELERVTFADSQVLYEAGGPIDRLYFPESAVVSIVQMMEAGAAAEIGMIGPEGVTGLDAILREESAATGRELCQVPGSALAMPAAAARQLAGENEGFMRALLRYTGGYCAMLAQLIACNRLHRVEQRCARWLLMTCDRTDSPVFPMTQEWLSMMLGAQRPTITAVMTRLREAGCLENSRRQVRITDRKCLESYVCECYAFCARCFDS